MQIATSADHAGFPLKERVKEFLTQAGHDVIDLRKRSTYSAHQGVEHDDMNVLVPGGRVIGEAMAFELVRSFVEARFRNQERHCRRLAKVTAIEKRYSGQPRGRGERI